MDRGKRALREAAAEILDRIRRDRDRAPEEVRPLLGYLTRHLFDPALSAQALIRACGCPASSGAAFKSWKSEELRAYYSRRRLETSVKLLLETDLRAARIAKLLGYGGQRAFSNAFVRWKGLAPGAFRQRAGAQSGARPASAPSITVPYLRCALAGGLGADQAARLIAELRGLREDPPAQTAPEVEPSLPLEGKTLERGVAAAIWAEIEGRPFEEQRATVRACRCPALFDLLLRESRTHGRRDRGRGVELVELALASLEGCAQILGDAYADQEALGWAWLGNARRLSFDFDRAEAAFAAAEEAWEKPRANRDPVVEGLICDFKATLRWFQRRFAEALALENRAISRFRDNGELSLLADALIVRGSIHAYSGDPEAGIRDLYKALADGAERESRLQLAIHQNLAWFHVLAEDHASAAELLPRVRRLWMDSGDARDWLQLRWVEGLVHRARGETIAAERCLFEVREGFLALEEVAHAAVAGLDLAILREEQGDNSDVITLTSEAIPVFETLKFDREALAALRLLREAVAAERVTTDVLRQARACLESLCANLPVDPREVGNRDRGEARPPAEARLN